VRTGRLTDGQVPLHPASQPGWAGGAGHPIDDLTILEEWPVLGAVLSRSVSRRVRSPMRTSTALSAALTSRAHLYIGLPQLLLLPWQMYLLLVNGAFAALWALTRTGLMVAVRVRHGNVGDSAWGRPLQDDRAETDPGLEWMEVSARQAGAGCGRQELFGGSSCWAKGSCSTSK
jgi:hypothetical protein